MTGRDDEPLIPRRKPFEIEGEWGEPSTRKYDQRAPEDLRLDASGPPRPAPLDIVEDRSLAQRIRDGDEPGSQPGNLPPHASLEERVAYLERMNALLWKVLHQLQGKAPADPEAR